MKPTRLQARLTRTSLLLTAALATQAELLAQTFVQPAAGTTGSWSTATWSPSTPTSSNATALTFTNLATNTENFVFTNDIGVFTANSLEFKVAGTGVITTALGSNSLTLDGTNPSLKVTGPGVSIISGTGGMVLNVLGTDVAGSGNGVLSITTPVFGTGGLSINRTGSGIFSLSGANTFAGGVALNSGNLQLGSATALGTGTLTINGGALRFGSASIIANPITLNSNLVVAGGIGVMSASFTPILTGALSGNGGIQLQSYNSTAGLTLQGTNTYTGTTVLRSYLPNSTQNSSTLTVSGAAGALENTSALQLGKNTLLNIGSSGSPNADRINDAATIAVDNATINYRPITAGTTEVLGNVTITGGLRLGTTAVGLSTLQFGNATRNDRAVLWLTGNNFGTITSPTVATLPKFTGGISAADNVTAGAETQIGILPFAAGSSATNPRSFVTYDATNGLTLVPYNNASFVTQVTQSGFAAAVSGGTLTNRNINLTTKGTYDLGGVSVTVNALTSNDASGITTISNGTLNVFSGLVLNYDKFAWDNGAVLNFGVKSGYIHQSWDQVFKGTSTITGDGGLVVAGYAAATMPLTFENTSGNPFTGGLFVNGTVGVAFRQDNQLGASGGSITLSGGGLIYNAAADLDISRNVKINGTGYLSNNIISSTVGATAGNATATTKLTFSGTISGDGALIKEGLGIVNLSGTNTYAGGNVITAGTLQFSTDANLGASGSKLTLNGGTLQPLAPLTLSRPIEVNANSTILTDVDVNHTGTVENIGLLYGTALPNVTKEGTGTLTLSGNNTFSGVFTVAAGTLRAGSTTAFGAANVTVNATGTLDLNGFAVGNAVTNNGGSIIGAVNFTPNQTGGSVTGSITGGTLNGTVGGNMNASGTISGTPTFTGTVKGNGTVFAGTVTFSNGAIHAPGNSPGLQTFATGVIYEIGSTLEWDFVGDALTTRANGISGDYDAVDVTGGNLTIQPGAFISLFGSGLDYSAVTWNSVRTFVAIEHSGVGTSNGNFSLVTTSAGSFAGEGNWSVANTSGDIILTWTPVPEPSTYAALAGLAVLGLAWKRRRQA